MNHPRTRLLVALCLGLLSATPLLAEGEQHLVALVRAVRAAPGRGAFGALLGGLADLPDLRLQGGQLRAALRAAGVPPQATADQFLEPIASLEKTRSKGRVTLRYTAPTCIEVVVKGKSRGWVTLEQDVQFRARRDGERLILDDIQGIKLSRQPTSFQVRLKKIEVTEENGRPVAKVTAGLTWPLEQTRVIDLSDPGKVADAADAATRDSAGINGALR